MAALQITIVMTGTTVALWGNKEEKKNNRKQKKSKTRNKNEKNKQKKKKRRDKEKEEKKKRRNKEEEEKKLNSLQTRCLDLSLLSWPVWSTGTGPPRWSCSSCKTTARGSSEWGGLSYAVAQLAWWVSQVLASDAKALLAANRLSECVMAPPAGGLVTHFSICSGTPLSLNCCGTVRTGLTLKHWMSEG